MTDKNNSYPHVLQLGKMLNGAQIDIRHATGLVDKIKSELKQSIDSCEYEYLSGYLKAIKSELRIVDRPRGAVGSHSNLNAMVELCLDHFPASHSYLKCIGDNRVLNEKIVRAIKPEVNIISAPVDRYCLLKLLVNGDVDLATDLKKKFFKAEEFYFNQTVFVPAYARVLSSIQKIKKDPEALAFTLHMAVDVLHRMPIGELDRHTDVLMLAKMFASCGRKDIACKYILRGTALLKPHEKTEAMRSLDIREFSRPDVLMVIFAATDNKNEAESIKCLSDIIELNPKIFRKTDGAGINKYRPSIVRGIFDELNSRGCLNAETRHSIEAMIGSSLKLCGSTKGQRDYVAEALQLGIDKKILLNVRLAKRYVIERDFDI